MTSPTTIVVQAMNEQHMRFDIGRAALQVSSAVQAAPFWCADIRMAAFATMGAAVAALAVGAYTIASGSDHAWAPSMLQTPIALMAAGWWVASVWRTRRLLTAALMSGVFGMVVLAPVLFWWVAPWHASMAAASWWTMTALLAFELLCTTCAAIGFANLLDCRYICDSHSCFRSALVQRTATQIMRGDAGNGHHEPRLGSGAMALHDASLGGAAPTAAVSATKKRE